MTTFKGRVARNFLVIRAARQIRQEIEKAGMDNLKVLADRGVSIIVTYLNGCSPQEKATYRRDLNTLVQMGVTPDMLLTEVTRQMPEIAPMIESRPDYKKTEVQHLEQFILKG